MDLSGKLIEGTGTYQVKEVAPFDDFYSSDFSSGVDTWSGSETTVVGNVDGINGIDDCLKITTSAVNTIHHCYRAMGQSANQVSIVEFDFYIPSGQSNVDGFYTGNSYDLTYVLEGEMDRSNGSYTGRWMHYKIKVRFANAFATRIYPSSSVAGGAGAAFSGSGIAGDDIMYVKNIRIYEVPSLPTLDKGSHYLECTSAGTVAIPSDQAYGEWEFDLYKDKDGNSPYIQFISDYVSNYLDTNQNGYMFYLGSSEEINLSKNSGTGSPVLLCQSSYPLIDWDIWYRIKITRTLDGEFYTYIKGGDFGTNDWTLVTAATGSNPVTDNTHTTSKYFTIDLDLGDRIANLKITNEVRQ